MIKVLGDDEIIIITLDTGHAQQLELLLRTSQSDIAAWIQPLLQRVTERNRRDS